MILLDNDVNVFHGSSHGTMVLSTIGGYMVDSLIGTAALLVKVKHQ